MSISEIHLAAQTLYVVATPIGHRDDLSPRAVTILDGVDAILCEDTRHTAPLLKPHCIETPLLALHDHNESERVPALIARMQGGETMALVSDAGTPLISDPGYRLVRACHQAGIAVSPVPGPSALTAALSASGIPTDRFRFVGFLPARAAARQAALEALVEMPETLVIYEAPHRIEEALTSLATVFGPERELCMARELTKRFETIRLGTVAEIRALLAADPMQRKGEFVLVVAGAPARDHEAFGLDRELGVLLKYLSVRDAARCAADLFAVERSTAYQRALELKGASDQGGA